MIDPALNCSNIIKNLNDVEYASDVFTLIRREMSDIESFLNQCNAYWVEKYDDVEIFSDYNLYERTNLGKGYDKILNPNKNTKVSDEYKKYFPLRSFAFADGSGICNVYSVIWSDITTNNATRYARFNNNGDVYLGKQGAKLNTKIDYNILDSTFKYGVKASTKSNTDLEFSSDETVVIKRYNNCTNKYNLKDGTREVTIVNNSDRRNITFKYKYDSDNKLTTFRCEIDTKKNNGSINGKYIVEVGEDYIKPIYISRKGIKTDLRYDRDHTYEFESIMSDYLYNPSEYMSSKIEYDYGSIAIDILNRAYNLETLDNITMSEVIKKDLRDIDNNIKAYIGEIPIQRLEYIMRSALTKSSSNIREKKKIKRMVRKRYNFNRG